MIPARFRARSLTFDIADRALVMGILNVTPDSFFDQGRFAGAQAARARAHELIAQGARIIDVGGRSYAAGNPIVDAQEQCRRVVPIVHALVRDGIEAALSVDTPDAAVAEAALAAGASIINDCSGLADPQMPAVVAKYDAALVVMHIKGRLNIREADAYVYADPVSEISAFLRERSDRALVAGIAAESIVIDPGLEFGKEPRTDLEILARFAEFGDLGFTLMLAASRKSFIGRVLHRPVGDLLAASLSAASMGILAGARIVRAHDVAETVMAADFLAATRPARREAIDLAAAMPRA